MNVTPEQYADIIATANTLMAGETTVDRYGRPVSFDSGYAVGGACMSIAAPIHHPEFMKDMAAVEIAAWIQRQPSNVEYFGSWWDAEKEAMVFDGVTIIEDLVEAQILGVIRGQKEIYSFAEERCL